MSTPELQAAGVELYARLGEGLRALSPPLPEQQVAVGERPPNAPPEVLAADRGRMCALMKAQRALGANENLCSWFRASPYYQNHLQPQAWVGSEDLVPFCGRVATTAAAQKAGLFSGGGGGGGSLTGALGGCQDGAWELACGWGEDGLYNRDPKDVGYGQLAYGGVPLACYCAALDRCSEPVLASHAALGQVRPETGGAGAPGTAGR
jgi:hypothetical protein